MATGTTGDGVDAAAEIADTDSRSKYASEQAPPRHESEPAAPVRQYVEAVRSRSSRAVRRYRFLGTAGRIPGQVPGMNVPPLDEGEEREIRELQQPEVEGRSAAEEDADAAEAANFVETGSEHVESAASETSAVTIVASGHEDVEEPATGHPVADEILAEAHAASREPSEDQQHEELALAEEAIEKEHATPTEVDPTADTAADGVQAEPGERQSANVREQGGRYMQRLTRRMRRRMRGGEGKPEGRPEGRPEPRADGQVVETERPPKSRPSKPHPNPRPHR